MKHTHTHCLSHRRTVCLFAWRAVRADSSCSQCRMHTFEIYKLNYVLFDGSYAFRNSLRFLSRHRYSSFNANHLFLGSFDSLLFLPTKNTFGWKVEKESGFWFGLKCTTVDWNVSKFRDTKKTIRRKLKEFHDEFVDTHDQVSTKVKT